MPLGLGKIIYEEPQERLSQKTDFDQFCFRCGGQIHYYNDYGDRIKLVLIPYRILPKKPWGEETLGTHFYHKVCYNIEKKR